MKITNDSWQFKTTQVDALGFIFCLLGFYLVKGSKLLPQFVYKQASFNFINIGNFTHGIDPPLFYT